MNETIELLLDIKVTSTEELTLKKAQALVVDALRSDKKFSVFLDTREGLKCVGYSARGLVYDESELAGRVVFHDLEEITLPEKTKLTPIFINFVTGKWEVVGFNVVMEKDKEEELVIFPVSNFGLTTNKYNELPIYHFELSTNRKLLNGNCVQPYVVTHLRYLFESEAHCIGQLTEIFPENKEIEVKLRYESHPELRKNKANYYRREGWHAVPVFSLVSGDIHRLEAFVLFSVEDEVGTIPYAFFFRKTIPLEACKFTEFKSLRESDQLKYVSKLLVTIQGGRSVDELDAQELIRFERIGKIFKGSLGYEE